MPVTVTVCVTCQVVVVKVRAAGAAVPSLGSSLVTATRTGPAGCAIRTTVKVAVPPASGVVRPVVGSTSRPYSLSALTAWTVPAAAGGGPSASYSASWVAPAFTVRVTV